MDRGECVLSIVIVYWPWQWMLTVVMCIGHSNGYCHGNMYTLAMGTEVFAIVMGIDHVVCLLHLLDYPTCKKFTQLSVPTKFFSNTAVTEL